MIKIILIGILIFTFSCAEKKSFNNDGNYWSDEDINELNHIVEIYDAVLTAAYLTSDEKEAYISFSRAFVVSIKIKGAFIAPNGLDIDITKFKVFDKIWKRFPGNEFEDYSINFYPKSQYFDYLESISKNSGFIEKYIDSFDKANDLTPTAIIFFAENVQEMNLSDLNYRLVVALHYLTLMNR